MRIEKDFIGEKNIPKTALYGIHSLRAVENFPNHDVFSKEWYKAIGLTKLSCYLTYQKYADAVVKKYGEDKISFFSKDKIDALILAAQEVSAGQHFEHFIVPAIQGGAGTSINMNINEIIANRALIILGQEPGNYDIIDPIEHANVFQSTNDVIPSALKLSIMILLEQLEESINKLRTEFEKKESEYRNVLRLAYTQMQAAVPSTYGQLFSSYNEALSRDWWRVSKCFERIKTVNLGGGAIGTGISAPRFYILEVAQQLQKLSGMPIARSENMPDTTANLDSFVEVHAILKSLAVNLEKISSDIRLLASDVRNQKSLSIPARQVGSSIMPGKVNPVIPEFVISSSHQVYSNDTLVSTLSAQSCLELNAYLPSIGHAMIQSLKLLIAACNSMSENMISGITIDAELSESQVFSSPAITTALIPMIGYHKATQLSKYMSEQNCTVMEANQALKLIESHDLLRLIQTDKLTQMGYRIEDVLEEE